MNTQISTDSPMARIRRAFPLLRRSHPWALVHSGGVVAIFGCLCGATHSTSGGTNGGVGFHGRDLPHVRAWKRQHEGCAQQIADRLGEGARLTTVSAHHPRLYVAMLAVAFGAVEVMS